jgi:membrane associated rhomboid family serine protease
MNALLFGAQVLTKDALTVQGAKVNSLILAGQYWRFLTPAFLHGNLMHLVINCYSLNNLAPMVESLSGSKRLLAVYLVAAVGGNVASFFGSAAPSLGASGAVFGVGGALGMYFYQNRELWGKKADYMLKSLWQTLLINLVYGLASPRIDNWGHLGGLAGGAVAAWLLGPRLRFTKVGSDTFLVDQPPIRLLASPTRQVKQANLKKFM